MSQYYRYLLFVDIENEHVFVGGADTVHDVYNLIWNENIGLRKNYGVDCLHWLVFRGVEKIIDFYM
jgi:hypothetical protein